MLGKMKGWKGLIAQNLRWHGILGWLDSPGCNVKFRIKYMWVNDSFIFVKIDVCLLPVLTFLFPSIFLFRCGLPVSSRFTGFAITGFADPFVGPSFQFAQGWNNFFKLSKSSCFVIRWQLTYAILVHHHNFKQSNLIGRRKTEILMQLRNLRSIYTDSNTKPCWG